MYSRGVSTQPIPLERSAIVAALERAGGNIGKAARALGASRRTLQNRMREYGMPHGKAGRRHRRLPYAVSAPTRRIVTAIGGVAAVAGAVVGVILAGRYVARSRPA